MSKPPGSFGWFGGMSDTAKMGADPVAYVKAKKVEHGPVFCTKVATIPGLFAAGYKEVSEVLREVEQFPPKDSMLSLIGDVAGTEFLLDTRVKNVASWRAVLATTFYEPGSRVNRFATANCLSGPHQNTLHEVTDACVSNWVKGGSVSSMYDAAKELANSVLFKLLLDMSYEEAAQAGIPSLLKAQWKGCESLPISGIPFVASNHETGAAARKELVKIVAKRLAKYPGCCPLLAQCSEAQKREAPGHIVYLLHGMIPKALASALLYVWLAVSRQDKRRIKTDQAYLDACIVEAMRTSPPVGVMSRGVACSTFSGYVLETKKHGEWKSWAAISAANTDAKAYGSTAGDFNPERWMKPAKQPPQPLTFGTGPRECPGSGVALAFVHATTASLLRHGFFPSMPLPASEKTLPVRRPTDKIPCTFTRL